MFSTAYEPPGRNGDTLDLNRNSEYQSAEDWGIESDGYINEYSSEDDSKSETHPSSQIQLNHQADAHANGPNDHLRQLKLGQGSQVYTRDECFKMMMRSVLSQKVSKQETDRFIEQFRYTIIGSGLLEQKPLFSVWSIPADLRRRNLLFDQSRPWTHLYVHQLSSMSGGGTVAAIALYLHLRYRNCASKTERAAVALVVSFTIITYLFATARRRLLRSLREKLLFYMESCVQNIKYFDGDCVKCIKELQEIDIVTNGFSPGSLPNFLSSKSSSRSAGRKLRCSVASSLHLLKESYLDVLRDCTGMVNFLHFEQFMEIYDLKKELVEYQFVLNEEFVGFTSTTDDASEWCGADACHIPTTNLRTELRRIHFLRRLLLCALLTVESSVTPSTEELEIWTTICDHLVHISRLTQELSRAISNDRLQPNFTDEQIEKSTKQPVPDKSSLVDVIARIKHLNARLDVVYDSNLPTHEYQGHVDAVSDEIDDLMFKWRRFLSSQADNISPQNSIPDQNPKVARSPTLVMTPDLGGDQSTFGSIPDLVDSYAATEQSSTYPSSVIEGETPAFILQSSNLSREERISLVKQSREKQYVESSIDSVKKSRNSLTAELNNVLQLRKHR